MLYHADDVLAKRFGGEGTGGQSFFHYPWKVGQTYRFLVKADHEYMVPAAGKSPSTAGRGAGGEGDQGPRLPAISTCRRRRHGSTS